MNDEDALAFLVQSLRTLPTDQVGGYGYGVYLPTLMRHYAADHEGVQYPQSDVRIKELSPHFYAAAWELCRRGIIRPGVRRMGAQATEDGNAGNGYSLTPFGESWIAESEHPDFVPTEPGRFSAMLKPFASRFGPGFYSRAQEAVRCYGAHAYLACCVMCGAAAESIILAVAIAKRDEEAILRMYSGANGRSRVESFIIGQATEQAQREFRGYTLLLKYWRDEAAHGKASPISENEAYTSLAMLLRFAHFTNNSWQELSAK